MDWEAEMKAAEAERDARQRSQQHHQAARSQSEADAARSLDAIATTCERIHRSFDAIGWPGSEQVSLGPFRSYQLLTLGVEEIQVSGYRNRDQHFEMPLPVRMMSKGKGPLISIGGGTYNPFSYSGSLPHGYVLRRVEFVTIPLPQLTPELVLRSAARYCVEHGVNLRL